MNKILRFNVPVLEVLIGFVLVGQVLVVSGVVLIQYMPSIP
jgi:hypothetical protein